MNATRQIQFSARDAYPLTFGLLLGLALIKFGNPVILDSKISVPRDVGEWLAFAWPPRWASWLLLVLAIPGILLGAARFRWNASKWLLVLPLAWFGWQLVSGTQTVDRELTSITVWHFAAVTVCFFVGAMHFNSDRALRLLLAGLLAAFAWSCIRGVNQKFVDFPAELRFLKEHENAGWTNLPPAVITELKTQMTIITTNGVDVANPVLLNKYERGRVFGTLVYPNALAGAALLLFPAAMGLAFSATSPLRPITRGAVILLTAFLGSSALFWTGSKSGWLIAIAVFGVWLLSLRWSKRLKWMLATAALVGGIAIFALRFQNYFAAGATSVGARFDYWRAAIQTTKDQPFVGSGPGTFQRPYERIKAPEAEMARLTHNDYLQQFSDSGIPGGGFYLTWIVVALAVAARRVWPFEARITRVPLSGAESSAKREALVSKNFGNGGRGLLASSPAGRGTDSKTPLNEPGFMSVSFSLLLGCLGWFLQGFSEFSLYIPALAWPSFVFLGALANSAVDQQRSSRSEDQIGTHVIRPSGR